MNHGTQLSPAESAAMCGTVWFAFCAAGVAVPVLESLGELALAWLPFCESVELPLADPPPLPLEPVEALLVSEPLVSLLEDELGATGIVDSPVPLELDVLGLGLPPPFPPPTPGNADPY